MRRGITADLFPELKPPRMPPRKLMHVVDASQWDEPISVRYGCQHCGYETPWIEARTATEAKKGVPCPRCNESGTPVRVEH